MAERGRRGPQVLHRRGPVRRPLRPCAAEDDIFDLMLAARPYDVRHGFKPDVALLEIAAEPQCGWPATGGTSSWSTRALTGATCLLLNGRTLRSRS
jgi:hypothetical protein